jgi:L-rhamnose mutarotase
MNSPMQRHAFKMKLKPGHETEYRRRHDAIWPELAQAIRAAGVTDYSIFLDRDTSTLFAVQLQDDPAAASALASHPIVRKWWDSMADLMEVHPDNAPVCIPLEEMFHQP